MRLLRRLCGGLVLASMAFAAQAGALRVPEAGDIYLQVQAPDDWPTARSSNGLLINGPHVSVTLAVLEDKTLATATEAELAAALLRTQNGAPADDAGSVVIGGLNGERFRSSIQMGGASGVPVEIRVARIDATHMLMESVLWQPEAPEAETDQAWRIVSTSRLVKPPGR